MRVVDALVQLCRSCVPAHLLQLGPHQSHHIMQPVALEVDGQLCSLLPALCVCVSCVCVCGGGGALDSIPQCVAHYGVHARILCHRECTRSDCKQHD